MGFNIYADFDERLDQAYWILSANEPPKNVRDRLRQVYFETYLMFIADNPFLITFSKKPPGKYGEMVRCVYFSSADDFRFGQYTLANTPFWDKCLEGQTFVDALVSVEGLFGESRAEMLQEWDDNHGLHCLNIVER